MSANLLSAGKDPMGAAIADFFRHGKAGRLRVFSSQFDEDEIPVASLFRTFDEMPVLEQKALELADGRILDVGAGSGCHSLALKKMGKKSLAIDISPLSVEVMRKRGLDVEQADLFDEHFCGEFDTVLMLMNGSGIVGKLSRFPDFFRRMKQLLAPGGCILMDSSDLKYLYEDDEDGSYVIDLAGAYYGEVDFRMQYKQVRGDKFDWLYVDFDTLALYASQYGFKVEMVEAGEHYDYLAKLTIR